MENNKKQYRISENLEDHIGYKGEPVTIVENHPNDYATVTNEEGKKEWFTGMEELTEIK